MAQPTLVAKYRDGGAPWRNFKGRPFVPKMSRTPSERTHIRFKREPDVVPVAFSFFCGELLRSTEYSFESTLAQREIVRTIRRTKRTLFSGTPDCARIPRMRKSTVPCAPSKTQTFSNVIINPNEVTCESASHAPGSN